MKLPGFLKAVPRIAGMQHAGKQSANKGIALAAVTALSVVSLAVYGALGLWPVYERYRESAGLLRQAEDAYVQLQRIAAAPEYSEEQAKSLLQRLPLAHDHAALLDGLYSAELETGIELLSLTTQAKPVEQNALIDSLSQSRVQMQNLAASVRGGNTAGSGGEEGEDVLVGQSIETNIAGVDAVLVEVEISGTYEQTIAFLRRLQTTEPIVSVAGWSFSSGQLQERSSSGGAYESVISLYVYRAFDFPALHGFGSP